MQNLPRTVLCLYARDEWAASRLADTYELTDGGPEDPSPCAVITNNRIGYPSDAWARWPNVGLIHFLGTGYGEIDLDLVRQHGARVTTAAGVHSACVADHAMALLLSVLRQLPRQDINLREGRWNSDLELLQFSGRRVGLLGFGSIGQHVADRLAGFGVSVGYFARRRRDDRPERHFVTALELADWADDLVAALPGGRETHHLVGHDLLTALGAGGHFVNVGRGSTVDTGALVAALTEGRIRGAGIDVFEAEPEVPHALLQLKNVVMSPHVAGRSPTSRELIWKRVGDVLDDFFAGRDLTGAIV